MSDISEDYDDEDETIQLGVCKILLNLIILFILKFSTFICFTVASQLTPRVFLFANTRLVDWVALQGLYNNILTARYFRN